MEDASSLLEPVKSFDHYEDEVVKEAKNYFEDLIKKSGCDYNGNQRLCAAYYAKKQAYEEKSKKAGSIRGLRSFLVFLTVLLFILGFIFLLAGINSKGTVYYILFGLFLAGGIGLIVLLSTKIRNLTKAREESEKKAEEEMNKALEAAQASAEGVNALLDYGMQCEVINRVIPIVTFDKNLDDRKYELLHQHYGMEGNEDKDLSIVALQSGSVLGNPFIVLKQRVHTTEQATYYGEKTIFWTTYETNSEGHTHAVSHSETLTASVSHPAPNYFMETYLVYGNEAAPDLSFSRRPNSNSSADAKKMKKNVKKDEKEMKKLAEKELMDNDAATNFTPMANTEFESLFHAWNRDNEMQFRLLFTPLAQQNMTELLTSKLPYGDDFTFIKKKKLNYISSAHSQETDYDLDPAELQGFDLKVMKENFVNGVDDFFQGIYFDLAPLLSIPLYQMTKTKDFIYNNDSSCSNVSPYEQEALANAFDPDLLSAKGTITESMIKTKFLGKEGKTDDVMVTAYSFKGVERVDHVMVLGGDGNMHDVPVPWTEYIPIQKNTRMKAMDLNADRRTFRNLLKNDGFNNFMEKFSTISVNYRNRLMSYILDKDVDSSSTAEFVKKLDEYRENNK